AAAHLLAELCGIAPRKIATRYVVQDDRREAAGIGERITTRAGHRRHAKSALLERGLEVPVVARVVPDEQDLPSAAYCDPSLGDGVAAIDVRCGIRRLELRDELEEPLARDQDGAGDHAVTGRNSDVLADECLGSLAKQQP